MKKQNQRFKQMMSVIMVIIVASACGRAPVLTQVEAKNLAGVLCLPTYLPSSVDPTPMFYAVGEPEIPDASVWYKDAKTSEHALFIRMMNVTHTSGDRQFYDPTQHCQNKFTLSSNNFTICNESARPREIDYYEKRILVEGGPFITRLRWLAEKNGLWTVYDVVSTLSVEETKKIVASMCSE